MRLQIQDIANEAVAGLLWMHLNLPKDASKDELESYAQELIGDIRADSSQAMVEQKIRTLQVQKLCLPPNLSAISQVARRSIAVVRAVGI